MPCLRAFILEALRPAAVLGPVDFLAAIWAGEVDFVGFIISGWLRVDGCGVQDLRFTDLVRFFVCRSCLPSFAPLPFPGFSWRCLSRTRTSVEKMPCLRAFILEALRPAAVLGPVDFWA